jgi:predicted transcriptional regulator
LYREINEEGRNASGMKENERRTKVQCYSLKCKEQRGILKPKKHGEVYAKEHFPNSKLRANIEQASCLKKNEGGGHRKPCF